MHLKFEPAVTVARDDAEKLTVTAAMFKLESVCDPVKATAAYFEGLANTILYFHPQSTKTQKETINFNESLYNKKTLASSSNSKHKVNKDSAQ